MQTGVRTEIISPRGVARIINRLAYEIIERNRGAGTVVMFGIKSKGVPLARAIAEVMRQAEGVEVPCHPLDVARFRDDVDPEERQADEARAQGFDVNGRDVVIVDDVLFTGRTVRAALDAVVSFGRPRTIQLVVLIDRGHREYPIKADYTGRTIPTKYRERITVELQPDKSAVYLDLDQ